MARFQAVEVTAEQAWFLADRLGMGSYPWKLAITGPFVNPDEQANFAERCSAELTEAGVLDQQGSVIPAVASSVRGICQAGQWLEWLTIVDANQMLRGVLARTAADTAVVALRYAQMVTFTPLQLAHSEAIVPIVTTGLPADQAPARFNEFELSMDIGKKVDERVSRGADLSEALIDLGISASDADIMAMARTGKRITVELTAHEAVNGARNQTDVSVNLISTDVGLILVTPISGSPGAGGMSLFSPADSFAVAMAIRDLTERLPSGTWFPGEHVNI